MYTFISNLINSIFRTGNKYYPQVFLEECKYVDKEKKMPEYVTDNIEIFSDYDREDSDEESSNDENSDDENSNEGNRKYRMCLVFIFKGISSDFK